MTTPDRSVHSKSEGKTSDPTSEADGVTDKPIRSLAKAVSWRVTGSLDTMMLSWLFTGDLRTAAAIGLTEVVTKMVLYYAHERAWNRISLGRATGVQRASYSKASDYVSIEPITEYRAPPLTAIRASDIC